MEFRVISKNQSLPDKGSSTVYLRKDSWNDFSFVTMFYMHLHDDSGKLHEIGSIKIAFKGQTKEIATHQRLDERFESVGSEFFSLGQGVDFYRNLAQVPHKLGEQVLNALRDIVLLPDLIEQVREEDVFRTSLLRDYSLSTVKGQFARVFGGKAELTDFKFKFERPASELFGEISLGFNVEVDSIPNTNIHAVIGRNGVGKTTLLNGMIEAITDRTKPNKFFDQSIFWQVHEITEDYFSSLVSVSFSAFDPFMPPQEQPDPAKGTCYFYIGLKDANNGERHRNIAELRKDCANALISCFYKPEKTFSWISAINKLGSDENFASMGLGRLEAIFRNLRNNNQNTDQSDSIAFRERYFNEIDHFLSRMSSGHAVVLLTITRLVATVEEKTLVLLDEPESHLHPPLLSAFIRALSDLLHDKNGVAIIATHSPVVLQEIPKSCVWKIYRVGKDVKTSRPMIETFAENVGVLTSEVFSLEVERSGFHSMLDNSVKSGRSYEEIIHDYNNQLGFEGRAILKVLIADRERNSNHDAAE